MVETNDYQMAIDLLCCHLGLSEEVWLLTQIRLQLFAMKVLRISCFLRNEELSLFHLR